MKFLGKWRFFGRWRAVELAGVFHDFRYFLCELRSFLRVGANKRYRGIIANSRRNSEEEPGTIVGFVRFIETPLSILIHHCFRARTGSEISSSNHSHPVSIFQLQLPVLSYFPLSFLPVISTGTLAAGIANSHKRTPRVEDPQQRQTGL